MILRMVVIIAALAIVGAAYVITESRLAAGQAVRVVGFLESDWYGRARFAVEDPEGTRKPAAVPQDCGDTIAVGSVVTVAEEDGVAVVRCATRSRPSARAY